MYGKLNCLIQDEYAHPKWQAIAGKKDGHTCPADVLCSVRSRATAVTHRNLLSLLFSPLNVAIKTDQAILRESRRGEAEAHIETHI